MKKNVNSSRAAKGKMPKHFYDVNISWSEEDQIYIARSVWLPEAVTHGDTLVHAAEMATEAIDLSWECRQDQPIRRIGKSLLTDKDFLPENIICTVTLEVTMDVLDHYRKRADAASTGYRELMVKELSHIPRRKKVKGPVRK